MEPEILPKRLAIYIVAHADDWQLFMQPQAYHDLVDPNCKVVFITTTAGDAGLGEKFWRAREEGLKSSVRYCNAAIRDFVGSEGHRNINGRSFSFWSANNCTAYFLRLPDGNLDGAGFEAHNFISLSKFSAGGSLPLAALDGSSVYSSWADFVEALAAIIYFENQGFDDCTLHYINPDAAVNLRDHSDHLATGVAVQIMPGISLFSQLLYQGYATEKVGELDQYSMFWKTGMFAAYEKAVFDCCGYSTLRENATLYAKWCSRPSSFIVIPAVQAKQTAG